MIPSRRLLPIVIAGTALVACGGDGESTAPSAPAEATSAPIDDAATDDTATDDTLTNEPATDGTATPPSADGPVPEALDFAAPLVGGGEIELGAYAGRPVLLWFWAPW